ncbi:MAG: hypothetical protein GX227_04155 [Clostridiaceae bacterium]|nr:hypothetical protein [Clostridiaceae bacterium]
MNSNIEKILSISTGVLLIAIAFTVFFISYNRHLDYIKSSIRVFEEDMMVGISEEEEKCHITGSGVIHMVIEAKTNREIMEIQNLYAADDAIPLEDFPEIWIDGENAELVEFTEIDPARYYHVHYDTDFRGNIIRIDYSIR